MQFSLQPRFHLEIGLVRLVQAGRLLPIEQALADLGAAGGASPRPAPPNPAGPVAVAPRRAGPSPFEMDRAKKAPAEARPDSSGLAGESACPTRTPAADSAGSSRLAGESACPTRTPAADSAGSSRLAGESACPTRTPAPDSAGSSRLAGGAPSGPAGPTKAQDARTQLHAHLSQGGFTHLADAVENASIEVSGGDLRIAAEPAYKMYFGDPAFANAVREVFGKPLRPVVAVRDADSRPAPLDKPVEREDEARGRALANPEVRRFQEVFEGSTIHKVRNLKE